MTADLTMSTIEHLEDFVRPRTREIMT